MRYYCPNCWKDFWGDDFDVCPVCGYNTNEYNNKDYVDKLINALNHPSGDIQHWAIMILTHRKETRAVPHLKRLLKKTKDPSLAKLAEKAIESINSSA